MHVEEIDREHQTWFGAVNRIHEAMLAGKGKDTLGTLLAEMTQYTFDHFAHEVGRQGISHVGRPRPG